MARLGIRCIILYVDVFLIVTATEAKAWRAYDALCALLHLLGLIEI